MAFIPVYIFILFITILIDYFAGIYIEKSEGKKKTIYLIISIVSTCMVLFVFKYFNFFNSNFSALAGSLHLNYPIGMRLNSPVYYDGGHRGCVKDYIKRLETKQDLFSDYIFKYLYNLNDRHRKLASLHNMLNNYKNRHIPVIIYITPIDYQSGKEYVGGNFAEIVKNNIKVIKKIEKTDNVTIYDLSFDLDKSYFDYKVPCEHLNEKGRKYVAKYLSKAIHK